MTHLAFDSETELIAPRQRTAGVNTSPFVAPRLVLGTFAVEDGGCQILTSEDYLDRLEAYLRDDTVHLIGHNLAFDLHVALDAHPTLWPLVRAAFEAGRLHDTGVLARLLGIALGEYDTPDPAKNYALPVLSRPSLASLAERYLSRTLDKGEDIRLTFGQFRGQPLSAVPQRHQEYALQDATATRDVWVELTRLARENDLASILQAEPLETCAAWCAHLLDTRGIRIDRKEARRLRERFAADLFPLQERLVAADLGVWRPAPKTRRLAEKRLAGEPWPVATDWYLRADDELCRVRHFKKHCTLELAEPRFHLSQNAVRARLADLPEAAGMAHTPTGLLSITADDWAEVIDPDDDGLAAWVEHEKLKKILTTYLDLYSEIDRVYPRWNSLGARSGRMSASSPNIQNVPKRRHGIRSLFLADPRHVLIRADYNYQELVTLAEAMHFLGIHGPLGEAIRSGRDPHTYCAQLLFPNKGKIPWPLNVCAQLVACCRADESLRQVVGSILHAEMVPDTVQFLLEENGGLFTVPPGCYGLEPYPTGFLCAIPVITVDALTRNISFSEHAPKICRMPGAKGVSLLELLTKTGKEEQQKICRDIIVSAAAQSERKPGSIGGAVTKYQRQAAKAVGFGTPGGLGARKLAHYAAKTFGVKLTQEAARDLRERYFRAYPDVREYLSRLNRNLSEDLLAVTGRDAVQWRRELHCGSLPQLRRVMQAHPDPAIRWITSQVERRHRAVLPTGFVRGGTTYTAAANSLFQGLAAAVTKRAVWLCEQSALSVRLVVHDEIVVQCPAADGYIDFNARRLEECMLRAFREVCPTFGPFARVEVSPPSERWGAATDSSGNPLDTTPQEAV